MKTLARASLGTLLLLPFLACSSSSSTPGSTQDGGSSSSSSGSSGDSGGTDSGGGTLPAVVESCALADFEDDTAKAAVTVAPWDTTLGKKCIKIKAGSTVSWASTAIHPLVATAGGTTPSPIPATAASSAQTITFAAAGVYGYQCAIHTSLMHGAIWVVP